MIFHLEIAIFTAAKNCSTSILPRHVIEMTKMYYIAPPDMDGMSMLADHLENQEPHREKTCLEVTDLR